MKGIGIIPKILVIGGGIAGIIASIRVAEYGLECYLIEKKPSIGGHMIKYPKVFPTLDCSQCILTPKLGDIRDKENIQLLTLSEVEEISGTIGNWNIKIRQKSRYVDVEKCTNCGDCFNACPVEMPNEFDEGLGTRKAIYRPFFQAVPNAAVIDSNGCTDCGLCEMMCPANAIIREDEEKIIEVNVGAIILATGFDLYDPSVLVNYFFKKHPNVLTSLQMERMLDITGPTSSRIIRLSDGKDVKKVAYVLCCGSRNAKAEGNNEGVPYCSTVCCLYSLKQAILLRKLAIDVWIHYIDIRASGTRYEDFYHHAQTSGINFIKGKVSEIMPTPKGNRLIVRAEDELINRIVENDVDLVVLCPPIIPSKGTQELAQKLNVPLNEYKFFLENHPKLDPLATKQEGIFAAGMANGPKDIQNTVIEAEGAAIKAVNFVLAKKRELAYSEKTATRPEYMKTEISKAEIVEIKVKKSYST